MMMPLLCFDLIQGRSEKQIDTILDATHEVLVKSFSVPERDRYQIVREHAPSRMIVEDSGLGIVRTPKILILQVTTRPRSRSMKQAFYDSLVEKLDTVCVRYRAKRCYRHFRNEHGRRLVVWARTGSIPYRRALKRVEPMQRLASTTDS
jgi:hypothetical protein